MAMLSKEVLDAALSTFSDSIRLQHQGALHTETRFEHLREENFDNEDAAAKALGTEQKILGLLEKAEFAIMMGRKVISWIDEVDYGSLPLEQKERFDAAGAIIRNRFEYLVDGLEMQLLRLRRAQGYSQLDRLNVCSPPNSILLESVLTDVARVTQHRPGQLPQLPDLRAKPRSRARKQERLVGYEGYCCANNDLPSWHFCRCKPPALVALFTLLASYHT